MRVSIVIPTYHDWGRLRLCLESLARQSLSDSEFEVIVVNNDPEDPCPYELPAPNMVLLEEGNPGSYAARNLGIAKASGKIIGFTDSDCIPDRDWIRNALQAFEDPIVDRVAGRIILFRETDGSNTIFHYEKRFALDQGKYVRRLQSSVTANLFVRKKVIDHIGLFREDLYSGGDLEWGKRAADAGIGIIYCPDVIVNHPARKTLRQLIRKKRRTTGGEVQTVVPGLDFRGKLRRVIRLLRPPLDRYRLIEPEAGLWLRTKFVGIAWITNIAGLVEWARLVFFKAERSRR